MIDDVQARRYPWPACEVTRRAGLGPALLRRLRSVALLRPLFFLVFGRSYSALWDSFAATDSTAREAILAGVGADEKRFWASGEEHAARYFLPLIGADDVVLDLGAGIGRIARAIAPHCRRVILADVSAVMLRRARRALRGVPNADFVKTSGRSLTSVPTASIDVAYSFLVLQHIEREDMICYLRELWRVLKPGGLFRFQVPNLAHQALLDAYVTYAIATTARSPGRLRYYTREELTVVLVRLGFVLEGLDSDEWHLVTARRTKAGES